MYDAHFRSIFPWLLKNQSKNSVFMHWEGGGVGGWDNDDIVFCPRKRSINFSLFQEKQLTILPITQHPGYIQVLDKQQSLQWQKTNLLLMHCLLSRSQQRIEIQVFAVYVMRLCNVETNRKSQNTNCIELILDIVFYTWIIFCRRIYHADFVRAFTWLWW